MQPQVVSSEERGKIDRDDQDCCDPHFCCIHTRQWAYIVIDGLDTIFLKFCSGFSVCSQVAQAHAEEDNEIDPLVSKQGYPVASGYAAASEYSADSGYPAVSSYPVDPTYATGSGYAAQSAYPASEYAAPGEYPLQSYSQQSIIER